MAIVFISPKQRQKMFLTGIVAAFSVILIAVSLVVFLAKPKPKPGKIVLNRPKINIDVKVLESEQVKNLEPIDKMSLHFRYTAITKAGKNIEGVISAVSRKDALKILQGMSYTAIKLKEAQPGRKNPFTPYYGAQPQEQEDASENTDENPPPPSQGEEWELVPLEDEYTSPEDEGDYPPEDVLDDGYFDEFSSGD